MSDDFDWNDTAKARLIALWAEGHSTSTIGNMMGCSKGAVVGKAHRMKLPARLSPIKGGPVTEEERQRRQTERQLRRNPVATLPKLPSVAIAAPPTPAPKPPMAIVVPPPVAAVPACVPLASIEVEKVDAPVALPRDLDPPRPPDKPPLFLYATGGLGCQWPLWAHNARPGPNPKFCGQPRRSLGCSYCAGHARKAFDVVRPYRKRTEAA